MKVRVFNANGLYLSESNDVEISQDINFQKRI